VLAGGKRADSKLNAVHFFMNAIRIRRLVSPRRLRRFE